MLATFSRLLAIPLAAAAALPAAAAGECRYRAELHGAAAVVRSLSVGEIDRPVLTRLSRIRNEGLHDMRVSFDGASPRQLAHAQAEPPQGVFATPVLLRAVECLAARSARRRDAAAALQIAGATR
jgi:hypothetical protein